MGENLLGTAEIRAFRDMAVLFAKRSIGPLLENESPDGDLEALPRIVKEGLDTGLLSSPVADAPGRETGIWGKSALGEGLAVSLMLLEELAVSCGGVAMSFHAQGLGVLPLLRATNQSAIGAERVAMALTEPFGWPGLKTLQDPSSDAPQSIGTIASETGDGIEISGEKSFVYGMPGVGAYVIYARKKDGSWGLFPVKADAPGLKAREAGRRTGLRAAGLDHLQFSGVKVAKDAELRFAEPVSEVVMDQVRFNMLGLCAIAIGVARGGLIQARDYAGQRWQGCAMIIEQPAVRTLLVDSDARIKACQSILAGAGAAQGSAMEKLADAARAKLIVMPAAAGAVTDCLQVFGGYGYMEDYRMEKRLRDVSVLKSAGGSPLELRRMIAEATL